MELPALCRDARGRTALYGRGVEDDKGPAIACVYAMRDLLTINAGQLAVEEGEVRVYFDIRYPVTASGETVLARMRAAAAPYGLRVWKRHEMRPVYMDKNSRVIRSLLAAYREQTGDMGEPLVVGGGTYARAMKNIVAFGPAARKGVHRARGRRASAGGGAAASARNLPRRAGKAPRLSEIYFAIHLFILQKGRRASARRPFWTYAVSGE